jgi:DNA-binding NarL/FixJ family response regulator
LVIVETVRVLIADDNVLFAQTLEMILEDDERFEVVGSARDGVEAVELAESLNPDVVLMDITMPRVDGLEATRRLRELGSPVHVVVLTESDFPGDIVRAQRSGADGYVPKTRLVQRLRDAILEAAR